MLEFKGKYNIAKVFTDNVESEAISQVIQLLNQPFIENSQVRFMPDIHAGKGCTIGFSAKIEGMAIPNLVGVDIGCGVLVVNLGKIDIELEQLDNYIRNNVPHGFNIHERQRKWKELENLKMYDKLERIDRIYKSIGTLGGGNHFIEIDMDDEGNKYLLIHSGSRNLGKQVCEYYQRIAKETCENSTKDLEYLTGENYENYIHDMKITQDYATENRKQMAINIFKFLNLDINSFNADTLFHTVHNYIDNEGTIRKGSVSAKLGEKLIIPLNMRDGSLICVGKGNADWNETAPHGAGRIMARGRAKRELNVDDFKDTMKEIYSTSVSESTLDESPFAYKDYQEIIDNIGDTVDILKHIRPIYNFKA